MANGNLSIQTSITARPAKGYPGMVDATAPHTIITAYNAEASASIPFGKAVCWDPSAPANELSVTLPAGAQTTPVMGIVVYRGAYSRAWTDSDGVVHGDLDATGLVPGTVMGILRRGRILVTAASTVVAGVSRLYVRSVAGLGETLGALEDAADSTDMIDCTNQGQWMSSVAAGELAWLEVDFTASANIGS